MDLNEFFSDLSFCFFGLSFFLMILVIFIFGIFFLFVPNTDTCFVIRVCLGLASLAIGLGCLGIGSYILTEKIEEIKKRK
jgi:hypothetical protein